MKSGFSRAVNVKMVKTKKQATKKATDAMDVENSTEVIPSEETEKSTQENGIEDVATKKKVAKVKTKKEKSEDDATENEEADDVVENGEDKEDKKKPAAKASKKSAKKESKPLVEPARKSSRTPKPVTKEGDSEVAYEVEKIVDCRFQYGKPQYLVRWKGYSKGDDTWEDEMDLNCPELLQKFKSENPELGKKAKKRPSKSPAKPTAAKKTKKVEKDYEVEDIVGLRIKKGKKEFKIRWKGYKENEDTWEPEKHLSCQDLIKKYLKDHADEVQAEEKKAPAKKAAKKSKTPAKSAKGKKTKRK